MTVIGGATSLWVGVLDGSLVNRLPIASFGVAHVRHAIALAALHGRHLRIVKPEDETVAIKLSADRRKDSSGSAPVRRVACTGCCAS